MSERQDAIQTRNTRVPLSSAWSLSPLQSRCARAGFVSFRILSALAQCVSDMFLARADDCRLMVLRFSPSDASFSFALLVA